MFDFFYSMFRASCMAASDVGLTWPIFYYSRLLEASQHQKLPSAAPGIYVAIHAKPHPLIAMIRHMIHSPREIPKFYVHAKSFLIYAYGPYLVIERGCHDLSSAALSDSQRTLLAGMAGGLAASFGESGLMQGQPLLNLENEKWSAKICFMSTEFLTQYFLFCASQVPARVAAYMQAHREPSTVRAIECIWKGAKKEAGGELVGSLKRAWFPGDAMRALSLMSTTLVYRGVDASFKTAERYYQQYQP